MGVRIRKKWDLQSEQGGALAVLALPFLIGGAAGCLLAALSVGAGAEELCSYLTGYLSLAQEGDVPRSLWTLLWGQMKYLLAVLVLGMTALGLAGLPLLFGMRGFSSPFRWLVSVGYLGQEGCSLLLFCLPCPLCYGRRRCLFRAFPAFSPHVSCCTRDMEAFSSAGSWWFRACLCAGLVLAAGLLEYWVIPVLLRASARVIL